MAEKPGTLEAQRDSLYQRLELGYAKIERGIANGHEVTSWEDFWVSLLHEYEAVCQRIERETGKAEGGNSA